MRPFSRGLRTFTISSLAWYLISLLLCDFLQGEPYFHRIESLLCPIYVIGVAFALNFRWAAKGAMVQGKICAVQGIVSQIGDLGAAIWSTAIAFHTFWLVISSQIIPHILSFHAIIVLPDPCLTSNASRLLFLVKQPHRFTVLLVLVGGWSILIFLPILGPTIIQQPSRGPFYGLSGAWCWIGNKYGAERVIYLYVSTSHHFWAAILTCLVC